MDNHSAARAVVPHMAGGVSASRRWRSRTAEAWWAYVFILPAFLFLGLFHLLPAAASIVISVLDWDGLSTASFAGLNNYIALVHDEHFLQACRHTFLFALISVPVSVAIATVIAAALNKNIRGRTFYRTMYFVPVVTMSTAVGLIWKWLFNSDYGPINAVLHTLHLPAPNWLSDPSYIMPSVIIVSVWSSLGHHMIVLLAGLQGIAPSYYEAAEMDGASRSYTFFRITLPLLSPSLFFVILTATIQALQLFDLVFVMTNGNPALLNTSRSVVYNVYEEGFTLFHMGAASSQAVVLFLAIFVVTMIQLKLQRRWVHYSG
ncbi:sugar ABC transporter permease [Paenibacillus marchantiophytorum]|uniref:Sugar ABC transporter permease n=1 Tax=Paenibacillus marchantiophytorum TaxID=1619310 RepID=A0ABQ1F4Y4_9BACL|nr:sugar ABC transporter permease [Paenibacillus marchantiophytorum]GGA00116.1 sugar ABC transporter permease [Paenibacillus marchantiophytorum]